MMRSAKCLIAFLFGAQMIGQLHAAPNGGKLFSTVNETTTAVPLRNATNSIKSEHTPTGTTSIPTVATTMINKIMTKAGSDSKTSGLAELTTTAASSVIPGSNDHPQETGRRYFPSTTAAPPYVGPVPSYRQFDALSFIGGALLTICLVIIGTMLWKMYIAHVERRYWTL